MEHLALPEDPIKPLPSVRAFCDELYDGGPFLEYLERNPETLFTTGSYGTRLIKESEVCRHYQTWLFFGLLEEFLGRLYHYSDFVHYDPGQMKSHLTTRSFRGLLKTWEEDFLSQIDDDDDHLSHFEECLDKVFQMLETANWNFPDYEEELGISIDIIASVAEALEFTIARVHEKFGQPIIGRFGERRKWLKVCYQQRKDIRERCITMMREDGGWCPNDISKAEERFSTVEAWHYLSHLRLSGDSTQHEKCDESHCRVTNGVNGKCVPQHIEAKCLCSSFEVSSLWLSQTYISGAFPCIKLSCRGKFPNKRRIQRQPEKLEISIEALPFGEASRGSYTAISHVWSNGTGNSESNSLPMCQLWDLWLHVEEWRDRKCSDETGEPVYIWIDTLCCPYEQGRGKQLALSKMLDVYRMADFVLAIDRTLTDWDAYGADSLEHLIRLYFSPWMGRLWTTQEAIFAGYEQRNTVVVQFDNATCDWTSLYIEACRKDRPAQRLAFDIGKEFVWLEKHLWFGSDKDSPLSNLRSLAHILQYRATSVPADEALVLGALMRCPIDQFIGVSQEVAMCRFWKEMSNATVAATDCPMIQKHVVFCPMIRLKTPGFRWAPRSFLHSHTSDLDAFFGSDGLRFPARLTDRGLLASYPGLRIRKAPTHETICLFGDRDGCEAGANSMIMSMPDGTGRLTANYGGDEFWDGKGSRALLRDHNLCLLTHSADIPTERMYTYALWVHLEEEIDGVKYGRIIEPSAVSQAQENTMEYMIASQECCARVLTELKQMTSGPFENLDFETVKELRDRHVREYLTERLDVMQVIKQDTRGNCHDRHDYTFEDCVRCLTRMVHYFGHYGDFEVEMYPNDTMWCLD